MNFKTNHITDRFKETFIFCPNEVVLQAAQEYMFAMGFMLRYQDFADKGLRDVTLTTRAGVAFRYLYVDSDCRIFKMAERAKEELSDFKEVTLYELRQAADAVKAIRKAKRKDSRYRKGGWIEWNGGVCPVPEGTRVDVKYRNAGTVFGAAQYGLSALNVYGNAGASSAFWRHDGVGCDIVAYRLSKNKLKKTTVQDMVDAIVRSAGGVEVQAVDQDGYTIWNGGENPVPGAMVQVKFRAENQCGNVEPSDVFYWDHRDESVDIVAYRVCTPAPKTESVATQPDTNPKRQFGMSSIPLNLWSPLASAYGAVSLYNGSLKYGRGNYRATPVEASIYIAAALRHLMAWAEGEEFDPADGCPNLGGVLANIAILLDARAVGTLIDDRQLPSGYLKEREALKEIVRKLQEVHAGKDPRHYTIADKRD